MVKRIVGAIVLILVSLLAADHWFPPLTGPEASGNLAYAQRRTTTAKKRPVSSSTSRRKRYRRTRVRYRSRMVSARPGALIPQGRVMEIQLALKERKFLAGQPTGVYDAQTVSAMKAFQTAHQIEATGYPTARALHRLGLSPGPGAPAPSSDEPPATSDPAKPGPSANPNPPGKM
jgi:peptidoglycan hydrolase-like protein with peptidoglycan-binding domain